MDDPNLFALCIAAFASVFAVLAILAGAIRLLTLVFPARPERRIDPALMAAVSGAVAVVFAGARVTRIVEER